MSEDDQIDWVRQQKLEWEASHLGKWTKYTGEINPDLSYTLIFSCYVCKVETTHTGKLEPGQIKDLVCFGCEAKHGLKGVYTH